MNPQTYGSTERQRFRVDDTLDWIWCSVTGAVCIGLAVASMFKAIRFGLPPGLDSPAVQEALTCGFLAGGIASLIRPGRILVVVVTDETLRAERRILGTLERRLDKLSGVQANGSPWVPN